MSSGGSYHGLNTGNQSNFNGKTVRLHFILSQSQEWHFFELNLSVYEILFLLGKVFLLATWATSPMLEQTALKRMLKSFFAIGPHSHQMLWLTISVLAVASLKKNADVTRFTLLYRQNSENAWNVVKLQWHFHFFLKTGRHLLSPPN